jgi:hypothetical protein
MDDREFKRLLDALGYSFEGYRRLRKLDLVAIRCHYPSYRPANESSCRDTLIRIVFFPPHLNDTRKEKPWPRKSTSA